LPLARQAPQTGKRRCRQPAPAALLKRPGAGAVGPRGWLGSRSRLLLGFGHRSLWPPSGPAGKIRQSALSTSVS
jgi:hypothetical protein